MTRLSLHRTVAVLVVAMSFTAAAWAETLDGLNSLFASGELAARTANPASAKRGAGKGFDDPIPGQSYSLPLVHVPEGAAVRERTANLHVGQQNGGKLRIGEPPSPIGKDGRLKAQGIPGRLWWTLGAAVTGAGVGFLVGGPVGALIGAALLGLAGFFFGG
ncbi:MAG: hypothetical protein ABII00_02065 [Elusimicrobiota bacterium]